jgi:hypothetical protein
MANYLIETVHVFSEGHAGGIRIPRSQYDPATHERWIEDPAVVAEAVAEAVAEPGARLVELDGFVLEDCVNKDLAELLRGYGYSTALEIHRASVEDLTRIDGIGDRRAQALKKDAAVYVDVKEE